MDIYGSGSKGMIFRLKTFKTVYIENSKDIYGDRREKLDCLNGSQLAKMKKSIPDMSLP